MEFPIYFTLDIVNLVGVYGGVTVNTQVLAHYNYYEKEFADDIIIIGEKGKPISKTDVAAFIKTLDEMLDMDKYEGRSYFYEGLGYRNNTFIIN